MCGYMRVKEAKSHKSVPIVIITYCDNLKRIACGSHLDYLDHITDLRPKRCTYVRFTSVHCPVSTLVVSFKQPQESESTFESYVLAD